MDGPAMAIRKFDPRCFVLACAVKLPMSFGHEKSRFKLFALGVGPRGAHRV
jgi:hypothetical protein